MEVETTPAQSAAKDTARPPTRLGRLWQGWGKPILIAAVLVFTFRSSFADWNDVPSASMEPTILVGDRIFVNKLAYDFKVPFTTWRLAEWDEPQRGDVVVFFSPRDGRRMVKRVVGVPSDTISMSQNRLLLNGAMLEYETDGADALASLDLTDQPPYLFAFEHLGGAVHPVMAQPTKQAVRSMRPVTVPAGQYFLMGDNRDNSGDSRFFGFVPRDQIVGKAVGLAFSLDRDGSYRPRWERFFRSLP
jgi:signal peptidase I